MINVSSILSFVLVFLNLKLEFSKFDGNSENMQRKIPDELRKQVLGVLSSEEF